LKISKDLILCNKKDGSFYLRSQRIDYLNPALKSPAKKESEERFRRLAYNTYGVTGYDRYKGRVTQRRLAMIAEGQKGRVNALHRNAKAERRNTLRQRFRKTGKTLVKWGKKIVAAV
jgi:hypothetical protein